MAEIFSSHLDHKVTLGTKTVEDAQVPIVMK